MAKDLGKMIAQSDVYKGIFMILTTISYSESHKEEKMLYNKIVKFPIEIDDRVLINFVSVILFFLKQKTVEMDV